MPNVGLIHAGHGTDIGCFAQVIGLLGESNAD
jgi:hypothetical protein